MIVNTKLSAAAATLVLGLTACAGTPPAPTQIATSPVARATATAQPASQKAESPFPGYTLRKSNNGQTLYCREDSVAGTRIPKLICATEETLRDQTAEAKQQIDDVRETAGRGGCNPSDPMGC